MIRKHTRCLANHVAQLPIQLPFLCEEAVTVFLEGVEIL